MKKIDKILINITKDKELNKRIINDQYASGIDFINNAQRYIKAIKEGRMICNIDKVSQSGMSRNIKFLECSKGKTKYNYLNFYSLFVLLGFQKVNNTNTFRINGCGMDMIFHTNYTIIHKLYRLGFMSKAQCEDLAQRTPTII